MKSNTSVKKERGVASMKFEIRDLISNKTLDVVEGKGNADRRFVELQKEYPKRKLHLMMANRDLKK